MNDPLDFSAFEEAANAPRPSNARVRFFMEPKQNGAKSAEAGRPIFDNVEMISIINPGSKDEFIKKVDEKAKLQYGPQYEHWKKTQEQPTDGTPLDMVPFLNPAQVRELQAININSLEHLASLSDLIVQKVMGLAELRKKAQAYMASAKDSAQAVRQTAEIEDLKRQITQLQTSLAQANTRFEALQNGVTSPVVTTPQAPPIDMAALVAAVTAQLKGTTQ